MISIPGISYANPGVFSEGEIISSGVSVPANNRVLCLLGEGARREIIINFAAGNGQDGWNSNFTSQSTDTDGRHFALSMYPIWSKRLKLYKNGALLSGKEAVLSSIPFSYLYDYRVDTNLGRIELQAAQLVDQGGSYYTANSGNKGNGTISNLSLLDANAPSETWTVRCNSTRQDGNGAPMDGYGKFSVSGSTSGVILDGYGAPVIWQSDHTLRNNSILEFSINEGSTVFETGDTFVIKVSSGVLKAGDKLVAEYIAVLDINDPEFFTDMNSVVAKHGLPSATNTISVGAQLAFSNGTPGILCCQAAPAVPRRSWYTVMDAASGSYNPDDLKFILPVGVVPNSDSTIKFLLVNGTTGVETEILPNKVEFNFPAYELNADSFITGADPYSYTVVKDPFVRREGNDLLITPILGGNPDDGYFATVSSSTITFNSSDVDPNGQIKMHIYGASWYGNNGTFIITGVSLGKLTITKAGTLYSDMPFIDDVLLSFRELDYNEAESSYILLTQDLALAYLQGLKVGVIDNADASFYDVGWVNALEKLESSEFDIIVPLPTQTKSAVMQTCLQHCLMMSRIKNRKERIMFTGAIQGLTPDNVTGVKPAAVENIGVLEGIQGDDPFELYFGNTEDLTNYSVIDAFGSTYRCVYHYPDQIVINIAGTNTFFDGMYMAAAHGGLLSATGNVAIPSTNKTLAGFSILRNRTYTNIVSENITKAGITLIEPILGGGRIIWGKTTSQSGYAEEEEISISFIRDKIAKVSRMACQGFIGQVESATFAISLQARINSLLLSFVGQSIITKFGDIIVKRNATEPRQWDITFKVQPAYPINWIYIKFGLGTF